MPRRGLRSLLPFFRAAQSGDQIVDASGKGETVSDEIQLTYQIEDLSYHGRVFCGASPFVASGGGLELGTFELECRTPKGLFIRGVGSQTATAGLEVRVYTKQVPIVFTPGSLVAHTIDLVSPANATVQARTRAGTIDFFVLNTEGFRFTAPAPPLQLNGFWVGFGSFIYASLQPGQVSTMGFLWEEIQQ